MMAAMPQILRQVCLAQCQRNLLVRPNRKPNQRQKKGLKRPASSVEATPDGEGEPAGTDTKVPDPKRKPSLRKPASEGTGTGKEKPLTIRKNYYKKDDRYGFVVGQREVMYVPSSHLVDNA